MIIRRIRVVLPARLRHSAAEEARVIAEALAVQMAGRGISQNQSLHLPSAEQTGAGIAHRVGLALPATATGTGGRHGD
jgi:hypothetical protein